MRTMPAPTMNRPSSRRAVASVLAMIFLVIFGSLSVAMAVVAQGNLRTADSGRRVSRALSAAETGMVYAARRLTLDGGRFVTTKGVIDAAYAEDLWMGTYPSDGTVRVLDPTDFESEISTSGLGIMDAIAEALSLGPTDLIIEEGDGDLPAVDSTYGRVISQPIPILPGNDPPYFRLRFELLSGEPAVRVTSIGFDRDISRQIQMDFRLDKKIEYALMSPSRIMIGKNVRVEGPLGSLYGVLAGTNTADPTALQPTNGDPLVMRSDFYYLDSNLDADLDVLAAQVAAHDTDGDGRLRPNHPLEAVGLAGHPQLVDVDGDGYVDGFDLFLATFDVEAPAGVVYDGALAAEVGLGSLTEEFVDIDDQLARLIDGAVADRDGDGVVDMRDRRLGYNDGVLDSMDTYAKVHGKLAFAVGRGDWEAYHGASYQTAVHGSIRTELDQAATSFEVGSESLLEITTDMFVVSGGTTWFDAAADGAAFADQTLVGGTYEPPSEATWEPVPYGSANAYDYYQRPVYRDMTFTDVRIPAGTNALFENCTFVGVTYIESEDDCWHHDWNYAGALAWDDDDGDGVIENDEVVIKFDAIPTQEDIDAGVIVADTRTVSNNIRFHDCTFLGSVAAEIPNGHPEPSVESSTYTHWRNKVQMTGNTRFYLDTDDEELLEQDDAATLITLLETLSGSDVEEMRKSSLFMPGWSVDVGNFSNEVASDPEDTPTIKLRGTIIVGILDVRGTADVLGTLLNTYRPIEGEGPLYYGGSPDAFNATIGYFGSADGDGEGEDPAAAGFSGFGEITLRWDPDAVLPDGIPWPIRLDPVPDSYVEGASQ